MHSKVLGNGEWVPLNTDSRALEARLSLLTANDCVTLLSHGKGLCTIKMAAGISPEQLLYEVRPIGCNERNIQETTQIFAIHRKELANHVISLTGVGGYLIPGNSITIENVKIHLPDFKMQPQKEEGRSSGTFSQQALDNLSSFPDRNKGGSYSRITAGAKEPRYVEHDFKNGELAACILPGSREHNQDLFALVQRGGRLETIMTLDGHYKDGHIAARFVAEAVSEEIQSGTFCHEALIAAPRVLAQRVSESYSNCQALSMGTCIAMADIREGMLTTSHLGDCRILHLRLNMVGDYEVLSETVDHSFAQELAKVKDISPDLVRKYRHQITRNIEFPLREIDTPETSTPTQLETDDLILSFSDGAQHIPVEELVGICNKSREPAYIVSDCRERHSRYVSNRANQGKKYDDFSLSIFRYCVPTVG